MSLRARANRSMSSSMTVGVRRGRGRPRRPRPSRVFSRMYLRSSCAATADSEQHRAHAVGIMDVGPVSSSSWMRRPPRAADRPSARRRCGQALRTHGRSWRRSSAAPTTRSSCQCPANSYMVALVPRDECAASRHQGGPGRRGRGDAIWRWPGAVNRGRRPGNHRGRAGMTGPRGTPAGRQSRPCRPLQGCNLPGWSQREQQHHEQPAQGRADEAASR